MPTTRPGSPQPGLAVHIAPRARVAVLPGRHGDVVAGGEREENAEIVVPTGWLAGGLELLLPRACLGCGQEGLAWCAQCLQGELDPVVHRPDPCPPGLPITAVAASYSGSVRAAVLAAKERDRRDLDRPLGLLLAASVGVLLSTATGWSVQCGCWLVPVPASPAARRNRGRDQVRDWAGIAAGFLRANGLPVRRREALRRGAAGRDSVGLDANQRAANLHGVFRLHGASPPGGCMVVVVDDVVTTGATLLEASRSLATGFGLGPDLLLAATVAATQRIARP